VSWPPRIGELLPHGAQAIGVRDKLQRYALNAEHERGRHKARLFSSILGITLERIDYLEGAIQTGVLAVGVSAARGTPWGISCVVDVPVRGVGAKGGRVVDVRTAWLLRGAGAAPSLTSAYPS
jgi:hypothetical protein